MSATERPEGRDAITNPPKVVVVMPAYNAAPTLRKTYEELPKDAVDLVILHPTPADYALPERNTNARSCVLEVTLGTTRVLLTGDIPAQQELELLSRVSDLRATILTAPHHGSRNSSSDPFVRATAPTWVVAQAGYRNRFGHPDPGVVARYRAVGAELVRTDFAGATQWRFMSDGAARLRMQRVDDARYWYNQPGSAREARSKAERDESIPRESLELEVVPPRD